MKEKRVIWLLAAAAMLGLGLYLELQDDYLIGIIFLAGGVLCAIAGITGRDYQGRKPGG